MRDRVVDRGLLALTLGCESYGRPQRDSPRKQGAFASTLSNIGWTDAPVLRDLGILDDSTVVSDDHPGEFPISEALRFSSFVLRRK